jgi:hypothetical protein
MDGQKCQHGPCTCYVDLGQLYCCDRCRRLDTQDPDAGPRGRCGCRHAGCENA